VALAHQPGLFVVGNHEGEEDEQALAASTEAAISNGCRAGGRAVAGVAGAAARPPSRPVGSVHLADEGSLDAGLLLEALDTVLAGHPMVEVVPDRVMSLGSAGDEEFAVRFPLRHGTAVRQVVLAAGRDDRAYWLPLTGWSTAFRPSWRGAASASWCGPRSA